MDNPDFHKDIDHSDFSTDIDHPDFCNDMDQAEDKESEDVNINRKKKLLETNQQNLHNSFTTTIASMKKLKYIKVQTATEQERNKSLLKIKIPLL